MSKLLCCENCGTMFDPQKGNCPICGGKAEQPAPEERPETDATVDDILAGLEEPRQTESPEPTGKGETAPDLDHTRQFAVPLMESGQEEPGQQEPAPEEPAQESPAPRRRPPHVASRPDSRRPAPSKDSDQPERRRKTKKKGVITTRDKVVCLILATLVIFFALFILYRFLAPHMGITNDTTPSTEPSTVPSTEADRRCTSVLVEKTVTLTEIGQSQQLAITVSPADTTDMLEFSSDAPQVAMVTADGVVTAMAAGEANITITCGNVMAVCTVKCDIAPEETTAPTEETTEPTEEITEPTIALPSELVMDREDISFFKKGETTYLDVGDWTAVVVWESSDPSVAKVDARGLVTAVGGGTCTIYARLEHLEAKCIVRCRFDAEPDPGEDDDDNDGEEEGSATISHTDVSLDEGESFTLRLKDQNGDTIEVQWQVEDDDICSVDGNRVKGLSSGTTTVYCTYKGVRYECIVRVR